VRRLFTAAEAGIGKEELRWKVQRGDCTRVVRGVYADGPEPPAALDRERATVVARGTVARGALGGVLLGLDSVALDGRPVRRDAVESTCVVEGVACASAAQVLVDLAALLDDDTWEQVLESALRRRLTSIVELEAMLPELSRARVPGTARIRRVLARRPAGAPPTESLLETLALQLARGVPLLGEMTRQREVRDEHGVFVARVDLCKPEIGVFFELDGQQHRDQPVYDAARETAVVAATGWLPGRFTWQQITRTPRTSQRQMAAVALQASLRISSKDETGAGTLCNR
jgi:very-short-patch-repair endonuclease